MSSGARLTGNVVTAALLAIAMLVIVDGLKVGIEVCQEVTSAFYFGQCPTGDDIGPDVNVLRVETDTTLRGDHPGRIVIAADGVTLDCASHSVLGDGPAGITVTGQRQVTIRNCAVTGFQAAIQLTNTSDSRLLDNTISASKLGISLKDSDDNEVRGNSMELLQSSIKLERSDGNDIVGNKIDRGTSGIFVVNSNNNRIRTNQLFDTGIRLAVGKGNTVEDNFIGGDSLNLAIRADGTELTVTDNEIDRAGNAIAVEGHNAVVADNRITNASIGIKVSGSNHAVTNNSIDVNAIGVDIRGKSHVVTDNVVDGGTYGAFNLRKAYKVRLSDNQVVSGVVGIEMTSSRNNFVRNNDLTGAGVGVDGVAVTVQNTFELNQGLGLTEPLSISEDTVLGADHDGPIVIDADGVTLDCNGHRIIAPGEHFGSNVRHQAGITVAGHSGITLRNCGVERYEIAILLWEAHDSTLENNKGTLTFRKSHRNQVSDHTAFSILLVGSTDNVIRDSVVDFGEIKLKKSNSNRVTGNAVYGQGITSVGSDNNVISNNEIPQGRIHIRVAVENTVQANRVTREFGTCIVAGQRTTDSLITDNIATGCPVGFAINNSEGNTISNNSATDCKTGFRLFNARHNDFIGNTTNCPVDLSRNGRHNETNTFSDNIGF